MSKKLFNDFPEVSAKEWKQKIQVDLKGADYENLIFHTNEGIDVKPFYHQEDVAEKTISATPTDWKITERFVIQDEENIHIKIQESLEKGAESLWFQITSAEVDIIKILKELDLAVLPIFLEFQFLNKNIAEKLKAFLQDKKHQISVGIDIIGNLAESGNWFENLDSDHENLASFIKLQNSLESSISINTEIYQNAGANCTQQLAYAMAHVNEYLNHISANFPTEAKKFKPTFKVALGSNYFFEIAKLKALRNLYATIASAYKMPEEISILAFPTKRNKTLYDYNVNMLRTTTECMSGILGGANLVCNFAYDEIYHHDNEFGRRIARNQLLVLKNESYFNKVANISDGSYYIETISEQLSEKALAVFKTIEKGGGFLTELKEGTIQRKIKESADKEQNQFENGEITLVGTNKYVNEEDKMKQDIEVDPFLKHEKRKTLIAPIIQKRLAEKSEQERLATENQ